MERDPPNLLADICVWFGTYSLLHHRTGGSQHEHFVPDLVNSTAYYSASMFCTALHPTTLFCSQKEYLQITGDPIFKPTQIRWKQIRWQYTWQCKHYTYRYVKTQFCGQIYIQYNVYAIHTLINYISTHSLCCILLICIKLNTECVTRLLLVLILGILMNK